MSKHKPGRLFFANPGPTNIPDSILRAMSQSTVDFMHADFLDVYDQAVAGLKRLLFTSGAVFIYTASGHGAWEATLANLFSPGDKILMVETGYFSVTWGAMAARLGLDVEILAADPREGVDVASITARLAADAGHAIKAICVVHNETSTGVTLPLAEIRAAIDAAAHPALYLADTISSFGSMEFRMDDWGIDGVVGGSQKGLMLPVGLSFTAVSAKAMAAHEQARLSRYYFDWSLMRERRHRSFIGTVPTAPFYGMNEAIRLIEEEGIEQVWQRHHRLAAATRQAVEVWRGPSLRNDDGPSFFCSAPGRRSDSVTAILMPDGQDAETIRKISYDQFNVSLGGGLGGLGGKVFRIGHLGDLNEPMLLGTLASVEMAFGIADAPYAKGGVQAAMEYLQSAAMA